MDTNAPAAPAAPKKINLRRPDVMTEVQAQVLSHYRSELVDRIRAKGHVLSADGQMTVKLAKEFGFCYGVERAIDLAYAARKVFPNQPIYILGEIIHNPEVNDQIRALGIQCLSGKEKTADMEKLKKDDVVIIPAFGTEVSTRKKLEEKGCRFVDTTCGDVMSVWKRVRQYARETVTSIIHGKAWHEETKATSSQATATAGGHYLVVFTQQFLQRVLPILRRPANRIEETKMLVACIDAIFLLHRGPETALHLLGFAAEHRGLIGHTDGHQMLVRIEAR